MKCCNVTAYLTVAQGGKKSNKGDVDPFSFDLGITGLNTIQYCSFSPYLKRYKKLQKWLPLDFLSA
jgi:hypothetical protein